MIDTVSITDLKQNTSKVIGKVREEGKSLVILQRSKVAAVLVDPDYYDILEEALENSVDIKAIEERANESIYVCVFSKPDLDWELVDPDVIEPTGTLRCVHLISIPLN